MALPIFRSSDSCGLVQLSNRSLTFYNASSCGTTQYDLGLTGHEPQWAVIASRAAATTSTLHVSNGAGPRSCSIDVVWTEEVPDSKYDLGPIAPGMAGAP